MENKKKNRNDLKNFGSIRPNMNTPATALITWQASWFWVHSPRLLYSLLPPFFFLNCTTLFLARIIMTITYSHWNFNISLSTMILSWWYGSFRSRSQLSISIKAFGTYLLKMAISGGMSGCEFANFLLNLHKVSTRFLSRFLYTGMHTSSNRHERATE